MFNSTGFSSEGIFHFTLQSYKHGKEPITLTLAPARGQVHCPVKELMRYFVLRPPLGKTLFVNEAGELVTRSFVAKYLKLLVEWAGEDPSSYNTHSLRVGRASDLALAGACTDTIRRTGRWKSEAYLDYVRFNVFALPPSRPAL